MGVGRACVVLCAMFLFFQAEDGIRDLVRSRGLGDVYKRQQVSLGVAVECGQEDLAAGLDQARA